MYALMFEEAYRKAAGITTAISPSTKGEPGRILPRTLRETAKTHEERHDKNLPELQLLRDSLEAPLAAVVCNPCSRTRDWFLAPRRPQRGESQGNAL